MLILIIFLIIICGVLFLLVPPQIVDKGTTDGVVAREGSNVTLTCQATGHPEPNITWRKEDGSEFIHNGVPGKYGGLNSEV